jgi:hypothetical protein
MEFLLRGVFCWSSGRRFCFDVPTREEQHGGVNTQSPRNHLGSLNTKLNTVVLNGRNRRLRNARQLGEAILAEFLKLANDANRFANGDIECLASTAEIAAVHG